MVLELPKRFLCTLQFIWESDRFLCIWYHYFIFTFFFWHSFWASRFSLGLCFDLAHYVLFLLLAKVSKLNLRPPPLTDEEHRGETKRRSWRCLYLRLTLNCGGQRNCAVHSHVHVADAGTLALLLLHLACCPCAGLHKHNGSQGTQWMALNTFFFFFSCFLSANCHAALSTPTPAAPQFSFCTGTIYPDLEVAALSLSEFYFCIIGYLEFFFFLFLFIQQVRDWLQD